MRMTSINETDRLAVMAYVDGELPPADADAFDARLAQEPALADTVARERALRAQLQSAYAPVLDEPMPAGLLDLLAIPDAAAKAPPVHLVAAPAAANETLAAGASDAVRAALPRAQRWGWLQFGAMAASLVLGVLFGARLLGPQHATGDTLALGVAPDGAITAQGALRTALEQDVAGTVLDPNAKVGVGLTFRDHAKQYCRTFTLDSESAGIACRQSGGWVVAHLEHGLNARAGEQGGYRTAASPLSPTLLQAVDAMRDGDTLDAAGEAAAKAAGWKP
ncbi:MAG: anti-sigma factor family protein [Vitreoscilla sp.]